MGEEVVEEEDITLRVDQGSVQEKIKKQNKRQNDNCIVLVDLEKKKVNNNRFIKVVIN